VEEEIGKMRKTKVGNHQGEKKQKKNLKQQQQQLL